MGFASLFGWGSTAHGDHAARGVNVLCARRLLAPTASVLYTPPVDGSAAAKIAQVFDDAAALRTAVAAYKVDAVDAQATYGSINDWDVSKVSNLTDLFR